MDVAGGVALAVAAAAALIDVRTKRIPNFLTFGAAAAAAVYHFFLAGPSAFLTTSLAGWATGVALFLPMFLLRGMGAGDVKLLGAVGAWLGPKGAIWAALYSVLAGGVLAVIVGALHGYLGQAFRNLWALFAFWRAVGVQPHPGLTIDDAASPRLAYGVAIAAGTAATILLS
jgi:prepilin peptidase CpaA